MRRILGFLECHFGNLGFSLQHPWQNHDKEYYKLSLRVELTKFLQAFFVLNLVNISFRISHCLYIVWKPHILPHVTYCNSISRHHLCILLIWLVPPKRNVIWFRVSYLTDGHRGCLLCKFSWVYVWVCSFWPRMTHFSFTYPYSCNFKMHVCANKL